MKRIVLTIAILIAVPAQAQQPPSKFIPYVINQEAHKQIFDYLNEQPTKFSLPLMQAFSNLAQKAIEEDKAKEKAKEEAKKDEDGKK